MADPARARPQGAAFFPALFVVLWSTGFIAAKYGLPYAPPFTFLLYRFVLVAVLMAAVALATRAPWPRTRVDTHVAVAATAGARRSTWAACSSRSTAAWRPAPARCWSDCSRCSPCCSRAPVAARARRADGNGRACCWAWSASTSSCATRSTSPAAHGLLPFGDRAGRHQRRHAVPETPLRARRPAQRRGHPVRDVRARLRAARAAARHAGGAVDPPFVFALGWSVLVLSVGAISLLYWLLRHGAAAGVARLFYLVPPVTAVRGVAVFRRDARRARAGRDGADRRRRGAWTAAAATQSTCGRRSLTAEST